MPFRRGLAAVFGGSTAVIDDPVDEIPTGSIDTEFDIAAGLITNPYPTSSEDGYYTDQAFPSAVGWGANAKGPRAGAASQRSVQFIHNLNDSGPGSARVALSKDYAYVIPLVSGKVPGTSGGTLITGRGVHYMGHFLPKYSSTRLKGLRFQLDRESPVGSDTALVVGNHDIIVRGARVYRIYSQEYWNGGYTTGHGSCLQGQDPPDGSGMCERIILDHCQFAFSDDQLFGVSNLKFTSVLYPWAADPIHDGLHPKGKHGYGPMFTRGNVTLHHWYIATCVIRTPRISYVGGRSSYTGDPCLVANGVAYNFSYGPDHANYSKTDGGDLSVQGRVHHIGNTIQEGPYTATNDRTYWTQFSMPNNTALPPAAYFEDLGGNRVNTDPWSNVRYTDGLTESQVRLTSVPYTPFTRRVARASAVTEVMNAGGLAFVVDPATGNLINVKDSWRSATETEYEGNTGPSTLLTFADAKTRIANDADYIPPLATDAAREDWFYTNYFEKWCDRRKLPYNRDDVLREVTINGLTRPLIEWFGMDCAPVHPNITQAEYDAAGS